MQNFDGSRIDDSSSALGFIIRDHNAELVIVGAKALHKKSSILFAEALALKEVIRQAKMLNIKNVLIEGDNLTVVNAFKAIWNTSWEINSIIQDIKLDLQNFNTYNIIYRVRETNQAADYLAHKGHAYINLTCLFHPLDHHLSLIL